MKRKPLAIIFAMVAVIATCIFFKEFALAGISMAWAPVAYNRNLFKSVKEWLKNQNDVGTSVPEPSYLRVEQAFVNGQGTYSFNIKVESSSVVTERKLERNDIFCCTHLAVYLIKQNTSEIGKEVLQTYPNAQIFTSASAYDLTDLNAVYNGYLWIKTEQKVNAEAIPMNKFLWIPETQQASATTYSQFNVEEAAYWPGNVFFFKGWSSIEIKIQFPTWSGQTTQTGESGYSTKLVLHPYGFLLKSAIKSR